MASLSSGVTNHQNYDNTGKRKRSSSASPNVISSSSSSAVWTLLFNFSLFLICLFPCLLNNSSLNLNNNNVNNAGRGGGVGVSNYFVLFAEATPIEGNEEMSLNAGSTAASAGYLNDLNSSQQFGTASTGQEYDNVAQNGDDAAAEAGDDNQANNANNESFVDNNNAEQNNKNGANQKKGVFRRFKDYVSKNKLFVGIGAAATATALIAGSYKLNCFPGNYYGDGRKQFEGLGDNATWKDQVKSFIPGTEANKKTGGVFSRLKNYLWKDNSPDNSPNPQNGNNPQNPQNGNGNNPQGNPQNPQGNPQNTETPQTETPQTPTPVPSNPVPNPQGQDNPNGQDTGAQPQGQTGAQPQGQAEPVKTPKAEPKKKPTTVAAPVPVAPEKTLININKMPPAVDKKHPGGEVWLKENTDDGYKAIIATAGTGGEEVLVNIIKQGKVTTYTDVTSPSVWTYENLGGTDTLIGSVTRGTRGGRQVDDSKKFDGNGNVLECKRSNVMGSRDPFFSYLVEGNFLGGKDKQGQFRGDGNANVRLQNNEHAVKITFNAEVKNGDQYLTVMKFNEKEEVVEAKKLKAIWNSDTRRPTVPEIDQKDAKLLHAIQSELDQYVGSELAHIWNGWEADDNDENNNRPDDEKQMTFDYQDINGDNKQTTLAKKNYQGWWKDNFVARWKKNNDGRNQKKEAIEKKQAEREAAQKAATDGFDDIQMDMNKVDDQGFRLTDVFLKLGLTDEKDFKKGPWITYQTLDEAEMKKAKDPTKPIWGKDMTEAEMKKAFSWISPEPM